MRRSSCRWPTESKRGRCGGTSKGSSSTRRLIRSSRTSRWPDGATRGDGVKARLKIDPERRVGRVDPRIFGHLLARRPAVADLGLYYPGHPSADEHGIRQDVEPLIREVKPTV